MRGFCAHDRSRIKGDRTVATTSFAGLIALLAALCASEGPIDIVSLIPANEYFQSRGIDRTFDKLIELAGQTPSSGKEQIAQLLALRQIAADAKSIKQSPSLAATRALLEQIAQGKKANDPTGFAAEYAKQALMALDGRKLENGDADGWKDGAKWIPSDVTLFAAIASPGKRADQPHADASRLFSALPKEAKDELFKAAERLGNIRVERIVLGLRTMEKDRIEFFVRATGRGNADWLEKSHGGVEPRIKGSVQERDGGPGRKIKVLLPLYGGGAGPAIALVGNTDFLLAGSESMAPRNLGGPAFVAPADDRSVNKMLALVTKPGATVLQSALKKDLAAIPDGATIVAAGEVPSWVRRGAPFPIPIRITAHAKPAANGLAVDVDALMEDEDSATTFVETIAKARATSMQQLEKLRDQQPIAGVDLDGLVAAVKSIRIEAKGRSVRAQALVPPSAIASALSCVRRTTVRTVSVPGCAAPPPASSPTPCGPPAARPVSSNPG
jgi:hypothetical protein